MDPLPIDVFGLVGPILVISIAVPLIITGVVIGVVIWAIRRGMPRREDPAVEELKSRLARGEIDPIEYQVRIRALHDGDE